MSKRDSQIDLAKRFNDPIAQATRWTPFSSLLSWHLPYRISIEGNYRLAFRPTAMATCILFFGCSASVLVAVFLSFKLITEPETTDIWFGFAISLFMSVAICLAWRMEAKPVVFDKLTGTCWKGFGKPGRMMNQRPLVHCKLDEIHALQIVGERIDSEKQDWNIELNLIFPDSRRMHLVSYANIELLRADARRLKAWLNRPLWDALIGG